MNVLSTQTIVMHKRHVLIFLALSLVLATMDLVEMVLLALVITID